MLRKLQCKSRVVPIMLGALGSLSITTVAQDTCDLSSIPVEDRAIVAATEGESCWNFVRKHENGTRVYARHIQIELDGESKTTYELMMRNIISVTPEELFLVLRNPQEYATYMDNVIHSEILDTADDEEVWWAQYKIDFPLWIRDRRYTLRESLADHEIQNGELIKAKMIWELSTEPRMLARENQLGGVRFLSNSGSWEFSITQDRNGSDTTYRVFADPAMTFPAWLENLIFRNRAPRQIDILTERVVAKRDQAANERVRFAELFQHRLPAD